MSRRIHHHFIWVYQVKKEQKQNMNRCSVHRQVSIEKQVVIQPVIHRVNHHRSFAMFYMWLLCMVSIVFIQLYSTLERFAFYFNNLDTRDVMRICLKYGIDPNAPGRHPHNHPISFHSHLQAQSSNSTYLSVDLPSASSCRNGTLDYNAYYTTERLFTLPPLFLAAQRNNHYACMLLLKFGANVNAYDEQHCSPLHLAARLQHNVCEILISHHASITTANKYGDTPLSLWPIVKQVQTAFVEQEFRKLCRKHSSSSRHYRFLSRDNETSPTTMSLINAYHNNSTSSGTNGLKNLRRVFRHSRSDSTDSKSFKKSLSSQSSMGKSRRFMGIATQGSVPPNSVVRSDSRQFSDERDDTDLAHLGRSGNVKKKVNSS